MNDRRLRRELPPGARAQVAGDYEQLNVLGSATGVRISVAQGDILPAAPRGFTWLRIEPQSGHDTKA